jgi:hypothetical protein
MVSKDILVLVDIMDSIHHSASFVHCLSYYECDPIHVFSNDDFSRFLVFAKK